MTKVTFLSDVMTRVTIGSSFFHLSYCIDQSKQPNDQEVQND